MLHEHLGGIHEKRLIAMFRAEQLCRCYQTVADFQRIIHVVERVPRDTFWSSRFRFPAIGIEHKKVIVAAIAATECFDFAPEIAFRIKDQSANR